MFDDRLFDTIMSEMMKEFGPDVRTDEGSLAYNACAKIAEKLEEVYGDIDEINSNMMLDTMDLSHLIAYAKERGVTYDYATAPVVKAEFKQGIEIGERFSCNDYTYIVTKALDGFCYEMQCETDGVEANTICSGQLEPVDYVDDYMGGKIIEILVLGTDDEDEEVFRKRLIDSFQSKAFGGNKMDYRTFINAITGVGGCKPVRRAPDSQWINVYIINSDFGIPSESLVDDVQTLVDPEQNHGEGEGMAPICHNVQIIAVEGVEINVNTKIVYDTGYSTATSKNAIEEAVESYLLTLRKGWETETGELNEMVVRIAQIEAKILSVEGVLDVKDTEINGEKENCILSYTQIPVLGGVEIV